MTLISHRYSKFVQARFLFAVLFLAFIAGIFSSQRLMAESVLLVPQKSKKSAETHVYDEDQASSRQGNQQLQLLNQVQQLQEEVQQLRGIIEEQVYLLDQLKKTTKEQYLDLDARISKASLSSGSADVSNAQPAANSAPEKTSKTPLSSDLNKAKPAEKKLYDEAQASIKSRDYKKAIAKLNQLLSDYPEGVYLAYAHYWLGEVNLALTEPDYQEAEIHFLTLLQRDANHPKAPAALFKLGKLYDLTDQADLANKYFKRVIQQYPDDPAATLAKRYLEVIESR